MTGGGMGAILVVGLLGVGTTTVSLEGGVGGSEWS
jgi:hypothetical protein